MAFERYDWPLVEKPTKHAADQKQNDETQYEYHGSILSYPHPLVLLLSECVV